MNAPILAVDRKANRTLRFGIGALFGLLGLMMLVAAAIAGSLAVAALFKATAAEVGALGVLFFLAASVSMMWIQTALRLTGARTSTPTWRGRALLAVVAIESLGLLSFSVLADDYGRPRASIFFGFIALTAIVYAFARRSPRTSPIRTADAD